MKKFILANVVKVICSSLLLCKIWNHGLNRIFKISLLFMLVVFSGYDIPINNGSSKDQSLNRKNEADRNSNRTSEVLSWNYEYDADGNIKSMTDPGGKLAEFNYECYPGKGKRFRTIEKKTVDGAVTYHFDEFGHLIQMRDNFGDVSYEYDQFGYVKTVNRKNVPSIFYTHNSSGRVTSMSLSNGLHVEYVYDFLDRLTSMKTPSGEITYRYQTGAGIIGRQFPNGIRSQYKYSLDGKLESITLRDKDDHIITKYSYTFNPGGLIANIFEWTHPGEY